MRTYGSKNPGATNVLRSGSKAAAIVTLLLDAVKGWLPVFVVAHKNRRKCTVLVEKPIEVPRTRDREADTLHGMTEVVKVYERYVRAYPEQWFNFHDFWRAPEVQPVAGAEAA